MRKYLLLLFSFFVYLTTTAQQSLSSMGTEFWTGFGYHGRMKDADPNLLSIYISAPQGATFTVSIPGLPNGTNGFPKTQTIGAGQTAEINGFPSGDPGDEFNQDNPQPDIRLFYTGLSNRGIHITSDKPVAVYNHTHGQDVSGATLVFPTNTWGAAYTVITTGGTTNGGAIPNSFFFIMSREDNTQIQFTPSAEIVDSSSATIFKDNNPASSVIYQPGTTYLITLNKGQVFNAMGRVTGSGANVRRGVDLTGTKIVAVDCSKKIAVFAGNGRVVLPSQGCNIIGGSDNLIQQMFPRTAWGTKYVTSPFKTSEWSRYRIVVLDAATTVTVNGTALNPATLNPNGNYYDIENKTANVIVGSKPIMVTQYMMSGSCNGVAPNTNTAGDPEMIILSPVQQVINTVTVFSAKKENIVKSNIAVVIKNEGTALSSFKLDGAAVTGWITHPQDALYSYITFENVAMPKSHTLYSDSGFTAIAYGFGSDTYGYNAGTSIKDLTAIKSTVNPFGRAEGVTKTCINNAATFEIALPYLVSDIKTITWTTVAGTGVSPVGIFPGSAGTNYIRSYVLNDQTYYVYASPKAYTFDRTGLLTSVIKAEVGGITSECGTTSLPVPLDVEVLQDRAEFSFSNSSCASKDITFLDKSVIDASSTIKSWYWNFGDSTPSSTVKNPPVHTYADFLPYKVLLRITNDIGCFSDKDSIIDFSAGVKADFTTSPKDTVCAGGTITFKNTSTSAGGAGPITQWTWNFGEGPDVVATTGSDQTHTYTTPRKFNVKLTVSTQNGCQNTTTKEVVIEATPVAAFDPPTAACFGTEITFTDKSTISVGTIAGWTWDFGDGQASVAQNPKHTYVNAGAYTVTLKVSSAGGCASANTASHTFTISALPTADFIISTDCNTKVVTFIDKSVPNSGTITKWVWHFDDGTPDETKTSGAAFTHTYTNGNGQTFNPSLVVTTDRGCSNLVPFVKSFGIGASPTALFTVPTGNFCLPDAVLTFQNSSSITDGSLLTYVWNYGDNSVPDTLAPAAPGPQSHTFNITGPTVTLTAISNKGCKNVLSLPVTTIYGQPVAKIDITSPVASTEVCLGNSFTFSANGSTAVNSTVTSWSWTFGDPAGSTSTDKAPSQTYAAAGPYTVALTVTSDKACISTTIDTVVTVNQLPIADFIAIGAPCEGGSISFDDKSDPVVAGATLTNWSWDFGNGTQQLTTPGATQPYPVAGTFTVSLVVKNSKGCSSTPTAHDVVVNPLPEPDFDTAYFCAPVGATIQFTASNKNAATVSLYEWDFGTTPVSTGVGQQVTNLYTVGQNYTVTLKATTDNQCVASTSKQVPVYDIPTPYLTVADGDKLCSNIPVVITNLTSLNGFGSVSKIDIYWDKNDPTVPVQTENAPASGTTYPHSYDVFGSPVTKPVPVSLVAYNPAGCTATYDTTITLLAAPNAQLVLQPAAVCQEVEPYILAGGSDASGLPGSGWYSGEGVSENDSLTFSPEEAGVGSHTITYTFTNAGCTDTASMELVVNPTPIVDYGNVKSVLEGDSSRIKPISVNTTGLSYEWTPGLYLSDPTIVNPVTKPKADQLYNVLVNSDAGCTSTSILLVKVLKDFVVPNTFSPNGDGINDTWVIEHLDAYPNHRLQVFNRYGQLLYQSRTYDNNKAWDGTFKGNPLPWGTYYYILELDEWREPKTGYVTILK